MKAMLALAAAVALLLMSCTSTPKTPDENDSYRPWWAVVQR